MATVRVPLQLNSNYLGGYHIINIRNITVTYVCAKKQEEVQEIGSPCDFFSNLYFGFSQKDLGCILQ